MPKYYVRCGNVQKVVSRGSQERAAYDVIQRTVRSADGVFVPLHNLKDMSLVTFVSEEGFADRRANFFPTHLIICGLGPFEGFCMEGGT